MRIISENDLCINRPYINLKKLPIRSSLRVGEITEAGFKGTYIINQHTQNLSTNENYMLQFNKGIQKITLDTELLHGLLLVEVNYSSKNNNKSSKFKVYLVLDYIKYSLPFSPFKDIYDNCMNILSKELQGKEDLTYIKESFDNLENDEISVDIKLNLERLQEFKNKVNYKRNIYYFVINNITSTTSKYDINAKPKDILISNTLKVLRYDSSTRLYIILEPIDKTTKTKLNVTDIICNLGEIGFPTVSICTSYGLGKLLDVKNNVIPNTNTLSLFANILDLEIEVL
ncbi:hypothetical protein K2F43_17310 [Clostridium estertheticum]|uniref:hypothetical protein n=1 Tax=Clostridium estertheticum TaxID=238834 RepID=UPI001C6E9A2B|nr:hypothetical protein [Clostridium estertheticum]MBW9172956.1 hypothetical protein [Clostridium estertheticum]WLC75706.1 hypothetical protein KTC99_02105 [Clostridium estertheticum]